MRWLRGVAELLVASVMVVGATAVALLAFVIAAVAYLAIPVSIGLAFLAAARYLWLSI